MTKGRMPAVHVLKAVQRAGQVSFVSVAFAGPSVALNATFRGRLEALLKIGARTFGDFKVHTTAGQRDWFIAFRTPCNENALDQLLKAIANELGTLIYIMPGFPEQEIGRDPKDFSFWVDIRRDKPSN